MISIYDPSTEYLKIGSVWEYFEKHRGSSVQIIGFTLKNQRKHILAVVNSNSNTIEIDIMDFLKSYKFTGMIIPIPMDKANRIRKANLFSNVTYG